MEASCLFRDYQFWKECEIKDLFMSFFRASFWDDITIIWNENIVYFFN